VRRDRSISLGFGRRVFHNKKHLEDNFYGEWEIGTYTNSWRVTERNSIIIGSQDEVDSIEELNKKLERVRFGRISSIEISNNVDVIIKFNNEIILEVLAVSDSDDEIFHIFGPENFYIEYSINRSWIIGRSNVPWNPK